MKLTSKRHFKTIARALPVALALTTPPLTALAESGTYWRDDPAEAEMPGGVVAPQAQSLTEVKQALAGTFDGIVDQIDAIDVNLDQCLAAAARVAGPDNEREKITCVTRTEAAKIDMFQSTQDKFDGVSRQLYGLAESYQVEMTTLDREIDKAAGEEAAATEKLAGLREMSGELLTSLDPDTLSREDEALLRDTIRAIQLAQIAKAQAENVRATLDSKRDSAESNYESTIGWADLVFYSAEDLDVAIARSGFLIQANLNYAEIQALNEAASELPQILSGLPGLFDKLDGWSLDNRGGDVPMVDEVFTLTPPPDNARDLVGVLRVLLGEPGYAAETGEVRE